MPPKAPKISEQEAKRLEEEQRRQQQEQARLEQERKKYLSIKYQETDLFLPASGPLIIDFATKSLDFITEKLQQGFKEFMPHLLEIQDSRTLNFIFKELHYYIKDSISLLGKQNDSDKVLRHQLFVGIMTQVLVNGLEDDDKRLCKKVRQNDEKLMKELVTKHCKKINDKTLLCRSDGLKILNYGAQKYFGRYKIITMFKQFRKNKKETIDHLYIETPNYYRNNQETKWVDLSEKPKEDNKEAEPAQQ